MPVTNVNTQVLCYLPMVTWGVLLCWPGLAQVEAVLRQGVQGTSSDVRRSGASQWVGVWREGPRGTLGKRSGEAKFLVLGKMYEKQLGYQGLKDRIEKRYRLTEGFWSPTGQIEREGDGFYRRRINERRIEEQPLRMEEPNQRVQRVWTRLNKRGGENQGKKQPRMWQREGWSWIRRNEKGIWGRINKRGMNPEEEDNRKWHRVVKREQEPEQMFGGNYGTEGDSYGLLELSC